MKSEISIVAIQCLIRKWAEQIREGSTRPESMKVKDWCKDRGLSKANCYYCLRQVRHACLDMTPEETLYTPAVLIKQKLLMSEQTNRNIIDSGLEIRRGDCIVLRDKPLLQLCPIFKRISHLFAKS